MYEEIPMLYKNQFYYFIKVIIQNNKYFIDQVKPIEVMMAPSDDWNELIREIWADRLGTQVRTRMSADSLDINHLRELRDTLSDEFKLERVDLATIKRLDKRQNMHIPIFFGSSQEFIENGIGFCIKHEGKVISMASTFAPFIDEFEIEVCGIEDVKLPETAIGRPAPGERPWAN